MSADLFAEFGSAPTNSSQKPSTSSQAQAAPAFSFFDDFSTPAPALVAQVQPQPPSRYTASVAPPNDENDDWGEFEAPAPAPAPTQISWGNDTVKPKKPADPNVLFDAEDDPGDGFDDDFGDFEGPESAVPPAPQSAGPSGLEDLLGSMSVSKAQPPVSRSQPQPVAPNFAVHDALDTARKSPVGGFGSSSRTAKPSILHTKQPSRSKPPPKVLPTPTAKQEDSWDSFDDWEATIPTKAPPKTTTITKEAKSPITPSPRQSISSPTFEEVQPGELPPTNVPPPGVLLSLFPPIFADAQEKLFKPMAAQPLPMRNKLLAESGTITYLQGYLMLSSVIARVIAGRKLRWKRDVHLSQGMRIGPASSRATSGMKLTGIDKSENMKEEREVSDAVRAWKDQVGRLRHVVSAANQIKAGSLPTVPDIQETMPIKTLKQGEGGVSAPKPCMLCGLKREERVGAMDQEVQDSFGEWWVDQVSMHRGCRNFWHEHKDTLRHH
ncbi:hypothetical protein P154DRAFT_443193 [Amniculicola lignicola CBS 123094]|uniref:Serine/threonine-protein kinase ppk6 n=1 Tax=Amniculicola lignicola CBS 123094 TaxID=1392246 RepID=A0A6A5W3W2_9PLEO|nr:hypothetical protein P154DRAFT_443193 [Amniculicola lignicola CBS 123094]